MDSWYLDEYASLTTELEFEVSASAATGKFVIAKEALDAGTELLEEVPLISWPTPATALGEQPEPSQEASFVWKDAGAWQETTGEGSFCDACLCVFPRNSSRLVHCDCCGAKFCCGACAESSVHKVLCGSFASLRQSRPIDSQFGVEAIARINATIAERTLFFVSSCGVEPHGALLNALRPWERICAFPEGAEDLTFHGASAEEVAQALKSTAGKLQALLATGMSMSEAEAVADLLGSVPHVSGLMQRLMLNSFQWGHPTDRALRFGGVFMMASNCNHSCVPNLEISTEWTRSVEDEGTVEADAGAGGKTSMRESCSFKLRTMADVAKGAELSLSYVDVNLAAPERRKRLSHWGFECHCSRCQEELGTLATSTESVDGGYSSIGGSDRQPEGAVLGKKRKLSRDDDCLTVAQLPMLASRERPESSQDVVRRVQMSARRRIGDWRYSVLPGVVPRDVVLRLSRAFFDTTELLVKEVRGSSQTPSTPCTVSPHIPTFCCAHFQIPLLPSKNPSD